MQNRRALEVISMRETLLWLWATWHTNADSLTKLAQTTFFVVGGITAYVRFFYGQTLQYRLETKVVAEVTNLDKVNYIKVRVETKNVGNATFYCGDYCDLPEPDNSYRDRIRFLAKRRLNRVAHRCFGRELSFETRNRLKVRGCVDNVSSSSIYELGFDESAICNTELFAGQRWIRPGETIVAEHLIRLPEDIATSIFMIEAKLVSRNRLLRKHGEEWRTSCIITFKGTRILVSAKP